MIDGENYSGKGQVSGICNLQAGTSAGYIERKPVSAWHVHRGGWSVMTYGNVIYVSTVAVSDDETVRATTTTHTVWVRLSRRKPHQLRR